MAITVDADGLRLANGEHLPLIGGSVQYWRLERALWPALLDSVCALGFRQIETYVPWGVHEVAPGRFDFGEIDPAKDLGAFLALCQERGLYVLLRPGPNIIAELTWCGFPRRILFDPEIQAQTRSGTVALYDFPIKPAPVPSYASEKLYEEFAPHLDAVFQVARPYLHPQGPVIGFQADNELSFFFRLAMFDLDYAPSSVALYQRFLAGRYGDIGALNRAYGARHTDFASVEPPRAFEGQRPSDLPYYLDWARYKEFYLLNALQRLTDMLRARGDGFIVTHNLPGLVGQFPISPYSSPYHLPGAEQTLDICGIDSYPSKEMYPRLKSQVQQVAAASRLPYAAEFGSGAWPWMRPLLPEDHEFATLALLMHGVKGINFYMLVDRDRWLGSPITRDNRLRPAHATLYERFNDFLRRSEALSFRKQTRILLLANRDYERLSGVSALFTPPSRQFLVMPYPEVYLSEETLGFRRAIPLANYQWWQGWNRLLTQAGCTFDASDTELPLEKLNSYALVITPTFDFLSLATQEKLVAYARAGGKLLLGPDLPFLDEAMAPCSLLADEAELAAQDASPCAQLRVLAAVPSLPEFTAILESLDLAPAVRASDPVVEVTLHQRGPRSLLYVANPSPESRLVAINGWTAGQARDLWTGESIAVDQLSLEPYTIRILEPIA